MHGDPRRLAGLDADFDALFRLDRLMNAGPPLAALGETPREFVDDDDLTILYDILPIEEELSATLTARSMYS